MLISHKLYLRLWRHIKISSVMGNFATSHSDDFSFYFMHRHDFDAFYRVRMIGRSWAIIALSPRDSKIALRLFGNREHAEQDIMEAMLRFPELFRD